jgi:hypothetical protein
MKIHNVFNSQKQLLASFVSSNELKRFIARHCRDETDTTILSTVADAWNEEEIVMDTTNDWMEEIWGPVSERHVP